MVTIEPYPLKFHPILKHRIWGGDYLSGIFLTAESGPLGEAWLLSGHPDAVSICANGSLAGQTLAEILERYPGSFLGMVTPGRFPVLIKLIDAAADLSVQVHPDDQLANQLGHDQGKTESWYVLSADQDAEIVVGLALATPAEVLAVAKQGALGEHLLRQRVQAGDLIHLPAGTVHALLRGVRVIEVQQTSDITYRLFDWNRLGDDGCPRDLHIAEAVRAIHYGGESSREAQIVISWPLPTATRHLVQTADYAIDELVLCQPELLPGTRSLMLIVTRGQGQLQVNEEHYSLQFGDTWLLPTSGSVAQLLPEQELQLLVVACVEVSA